MDDESHQARRSSAWLRSISPTSIVVVVLVLLAAGAYAVWGGETEPKPLSERVADCLDDYFNGVSLDPDAQGSVGSKAEIGVDATDDAGDEADVGIEGSVKAAKHLAGTLDTPGVERVGSVVFAYRGGEPEEREAVARCATGLEGTESKIERH